MAAAVANATVNATAVDTEVAVTLACRDLEPMALVHLLFLPLWIVMLIIWSSAVYFWGRLHALELHRLTAWVPSVALAHGTFSMFHYLFCPWRSPTEKVIGAAWVVVTILKEPITMLCLLLVCKGWCLTRRRLASRETVHIAAVVTWLYAAVIIELSAPRHLGAGALISAKLLCAYVGLRSLVVNLRVLKAQLNAVQRLGLNPELTPAQAKFTMFMQVLPVATLYFGGDIAIRVTGSSSGDHRDRWVAVLCVQALELATSAFVGAAIRPRPLDVLSDQARQLSATLSRAMWPPLRIAVVDATAESPRNGSSWSAAGGSNGGGREGGGGGGGSGGGGGGQDGGGSLPTNLSSPPELLLVLNPAGWWCRGDLLDEQVSDAAASAVSQRALVLATLAMNGSSGDGVGGGQRGVANARTTSNRGARAPLEVLNLNASPPPQQRGRPSLTSPTRIGLASSERHAPSRPPPVPPRPLDGPFVIPPPSQLQQPEETTPTRRESAGAATSARDDGRGTQQRQQGPQQGPQLGPQQGLLSSGAGSSTSSLPMAPLSEVFGFREWRAAMRWAPQGRARMQRSRWRSAQIAPAPPM